MDERAIAALDRVGGKLPAHAVVDLRVLRDRDEPARGAIEAMQRTRTPRPPRLIVARAAVPEQRVEQRVLAMRAERMDVHARRLVADEQVVVLVADHERERLGPQRDGRDRSGVDDDHVVGADRVRDPARAAADRERTARDQAADLVDRNDDEMCLRVVDEAHRYRRCIALALDAQQHARSPDHLVDTVERHRHRLQPWERRRVTA